MILNDYFVQFLIFIGIKICIVYAVEIDSDVNVKTNGSLSTSAFANNVLSVPDIVVGVTRDGYYYVNVSFGTPAQKQSLLVDTSKAYSWVISGASDSECNKLDSGCLSGGYYYPGESTTSNALNNSAEYNFDFIDTNSINGTLFIDTMNFTNIERVDIVASNSNQSIRMSPEVNITGHSFSIKNTTFISAEDTGLEMGNLGLAGMVRSINSDLDLENYGDSFIFLKKLRELGITNSSSYSLWLKNDSSTRPIDFSRIPPRNYNIGRLLLGAVDPSLYEGPFYQYNMIPYVETSTNISITGFPILPMGPIYISSSSGRSLNMTADDYLEPVLLDSSVSGNFLPTNAIVQIAIQLGATYIESLGGWLVSCGIESSDASLEFSFDDLLIKVPITDLLDTTYDSTTNTTMHFSDGTEACYLKLYPNTAIGFSLLGASFLKNSYLAVDMDNYTVAIAQAKNVSAVGVPISTTLTLADGSTIVKKRSVATIASGSIPYATRKTDGYQTQLAILNTNSATSMPAQFTGIVNSNGLISSAGRSFYDTSRTSSTSKKSTSDYSYLTIDGSDYANSTAHRATESRNGGAGVRVTDRDNNTLVSWLSLLDVTSWTSIAILAGVTVLSVYL